jgi:hypothetical protein
VPPVAACLRPSTLALFTAWHRFEAEIAGDATDAVVACVDRALRGAVVAGSADETTYPTITAACTAPSAPSVSEPAAG